jgi:hypothetical protein
VAPSLCSMQGWIGGGGDMNSRRKVAVRNAKDCNIRFPTLSFICINHMKEDAIKIQNHLILNINVLIQTILTKISLKSSIYHAFLLLSFIQRFICINCIIPHMIASCNGDEYLI